MLDIDVVLDNTVVSCEWHVVLDNAIMSCERHVVLDNTIMSCERHVVLDNTIMSCEHHVVLVTGEGHKTRSVFRRRLSRVEVDRTSTFLRRLNCI